MKILLLDNYDSFVYNIVHLVRELGFEDIEVHRNDGIALEEVARFDKIILSPGPGIPREAGILLPLIRRYGNTKSILGICLGHQAIGEAYGAELHNLEDVYHGMQMPVSILAESPLFRGLDRTQLVGRYHSWVISPSTMPECMTVTAVDDAGQIMALSHKEHDVHGVQFHPESILTPRGRAMIRNFLNA